MAMKVIAQFLDIRTLLIPGFRDVTGVKFTLYRRIESGEYDKLLISATESGLKDIVKLLLDTGADNDVKDKHGKTPLDLALARGYTNIGEILNYY